MTNGFKFIDLFAGIGGFRIAFESLDGECVFSSEKDKYSKQTYEVNFGHYPHGDITLPETKAAIPSFDILCAGFPCQAFSIAGKRAGFSDIRGTLFFDVAEIIKKHKPKAFFLENVKGLMSHDKGSTYKTILSTLREKLGYHVPDPKVINAKYFGVPQNRERVFIVGFLDKEDMESFSYPEHVDVTHSISDIMEEKAVPSKYYLSEKYLTTLFKHKARHKGKGNGFGYQLLKKDSISNTVVCGGMGTERNLIHDRRTTDLTPTTNISGEINKLGVRKLTPREFARLQGFPDSYKIIVSDTQAYKQFGNSVAVPAIRATARKLLQAIKGRSL